jgi:glutathione synthase/RimK-type ligase-like ATP-grasp enzyme
MKLKFAGIKRKTEFSPNHVLNDSLIIKQTAEELVKLGAEVTMYDESILSEDLIKQNYIFSMVQGVAGINTLLKIADTGRFIINSPQSVLNCYRYNMVKLLPDNNIPFPSSLIVSTLDELNGMMDGLDKKFWMKRGDAHAVHKEDVTLVYNENEKCNLLKEFGGRGITQAVLQKHIEGDTVKFYAIRGTKFFHWYYLNGTEHTEFNGDELFRLANKSAEILGLYIYGGDAIITRDSDIIIIDINDWPSFAPVRDQAALLIAELIYGKALEYEL